MQEIKHVEAEHREHGSDTHSHDLEKRGYAGEHGDAPRDDDAVTMKTWAVVLVSLIYQSELATTGDLLLQVLAASYGISFWPVPFFSTIQSEMAVELGSQAIQGTWVTSVYSLAGTIAFMICGANSDLFGRRAFILFGNILMLIGSILGGTSQSIRQTIAAHAIFGFGGGNCQIAAFALPELLPNKWRHIGVVIADAGIYFDVIAGPVVARIAYKRGAVSTIDQPTSHGLISVVEVWLLGHNDRTRPFSPRPHFLLLPTQAPQRYPMEAGPP
jgi:MFS family permease